MPSVVSGGVVEARGGGGWGEDGIKPWHYTLFNHCVVFWLCYSVLTIVAIPSLTLEFKLFFQIFVTTLQSEYYNLRVKEWFRYSLYNFLWFLIQNHIPIIIMQVNRWKLSWIGFRKLTSERHISKQRVAEWHHLEVVIQINLYSENRVWNKEGRVDNARHPYPLFGQDLDRFVTMWQYDNHYWLVLFLRTKNETKPDEAITINKGKLFE